jgi:hypothetical protein
MKKPMWDAKAVKAYETGQGVELVNEPYPHYEPVAWIEHHKGGDNLVWDDPSGERTPLYTTTPQRTWVGLTDEEIDDLHMAVKVRLMGTFDTKDIYRAVEAKLKEKNT